MQLEGRTAVITGASRGLGAGLAREFHARGMNLALCARGEMELADSDRVVTARFDISDEAGIAGLVQRAEDAFGEIDLWINNAGVLEPIQPLRDIAVDAYRRHLEINVVGVFLGSRAYVRHLRDRGRGGVLLNISSGAARNGYAGWSAYCASKAAVDLMTDSLQLEEAAIGLRAYSVAPGVIDTHMQALIRACPPERFPMVEKFHQLKRDDQFSSVEFVAEGLLRLAFDESASADQPVRTSLPRP